MPEITSVETIRAKLREFEERVDGAVTAAKALARVKTDAQKCLTDIQNISAKSEQSLQKAEDVRLQIQQLEQDWKTLKSQVNKSQTESKETRDLLLSELDSAIQSIGTKLVESEERLKTTNKASLAEQAQLLKRLDSDTRVNAETTSNAKNFILEQVGKLDQLLGTIREELQSETRTKLLHAEELLNSQIKTTNQQIEEKLQSTTKALTETAENNETTLRDQMNSFKEEMKRNLTEHQHAIDRQLTDFLNKQNALVQNLTQQIDSYNRVSQSQAAELTATITKLTELSSDFTTHKAQITSKLTMLEAGINELKTLLAEVQSRVISQDQRLSAVEPSSQVIAVRLDEMIEKLKTIPFVGNKFR